LSFSYTNPQGLHPLLFMSPKSTGFAPCAVYVAPSGLFYE
jgi:hypothetical protein